MKKIAVVHLEPMKRVGGGERIFFETSKILNEKYDVTAYYPTTFGVGDNLKGIESIGVKSPLRLNKIGRGYKLKEWLNRIRCRKLLEGENSWDLIFSTGSYFKFKESIPTVNYFHFGIKRSWTNPYAKFFGHHQLRGNFDNLTIVCNSKNTQEKMVELYDLYKDEVRVIYPPVKNDFKLKDWDKRKNGFVCVGRIEARKKQLKACHLIRKLKNTHLHIIGRVSNEKYYKKVKRLEDNNNIFIHRNASEKKLNELLTNHKFAISLSEESFGIAVGEYVNAGCIPFVYEEGAQTEIVDDERLICNYENAEDKIRAVLENEELENELKEKMHGKIGKFSRERFRKEILDLVEDLI